MAILFLDMPDLAPLQENFAPFRQYVGELQGRLEQGEDSNSLPGYRETFITEGGSFLNCFAIPTETIDSASSEHYTAQIFSHDPESDSERSPLAPQVEACATAMAIAVGHVGLEQIVAYSDADVYAVIAKDTAGDALYKITPSNLLYIPDEGYAKLFSRFKTLEELGLSIDDDYFNSIVLHDPEPDNHYTYNPEPIITRLKQEADVSSMDHLVRLGRKIALTWSRGDSLPPEAVHYYKVVDRCVGRVAGLEVIDSWLRSGLSIPSINYRDDENH